ncbi:hypothetical protein AA313_de0209678 [Arthrobotrys entomopaga]|nr:hypothetical protein AA313_de0209678 [Arthrobotrys entomopaga]
MQQSDNYDVSGRTKAIPPNARLFARISADATSAVIAAVAVAPGFYSPIIPKTPKILRLPNFWFSCREYKLMGIPYSAMVYAGTYLVANTTDTFLSYKKGNDDITKVTAGTAKFAATSRYLTSSWLERDVALW